MTMGAGPFTSLVSASEADPLPQTRRNATAILDKHGLCIEFLRSDVHDFSFFLRDFHRMMASVCRTGAGANRCASSPERVASRNRRFPTGQATPTARQSNLR